MPRIRALPSSCAVVPSFWAGEGGLTVVHGGRLIWVHPSPKLIQNSEIFYLPGVAYLFCRPDSRLRVYERALNARFVSY